MALPLGPWGAGGKAVGSENDSQHRSLAIRILWVHTKSVKVEFDPARDASNRAKHGVSLQAAAQFEWETALEREDDRFDYGELRFHRGPR